MKINEVIRKYRKEQNLTQEQVANFLGVTSPAVNKWEKGVSYPDITLLAPLARILKIDIDTLLSFNEELSEIEINNIIEELSTKVPLNGYEATFEIALDYIRKYPHCNKLILYIAQLMNVYLQIHEIEEKDKYEKYINSWMETLTLSDDIEISNMALISLCSINIENKNYNKAQELLDKVPSLGVDKRLMQASLFIAEELRDEAYEIYEKMVYESANQLVNGLMFISYMKCEDEKYEDALYFAKLISEVSKKFELGEYTINAVEFTVLVKMKDKNKCLELLERMIDGLDEFSGKKESKVYEHMKFNEHTSVYLIKNMLKKSFEEDNKLDFIRDDERFIKIIEKLS